VVTSLGLNRSADSVSGSLSASFEQNTYLISIKARAATPQLATAIANAAALGLSATVDSLGSGVNNQVSVQVVNRATPPSAPISPRPKLDLALGGVLGLLAGLLLIALLEAIDRTVKSTAHADALLDAPHVGLIPKRRGSTLVLGGKGDAQEGEPYRSMRTSIRFLYPDNPLKTLLVTSPTPGEGKTTTAANLAVALSLAGERVIIVDADLRRAALAQVFGLERSIGLTTLVLGKATVDDVLQDWGRNLQVLASGPLPPNPSEILGSQLVNTLLQDLSHRADVVIIDAPPVLPVADAVALAPQVDAVVMVLRHGVTLRHTVSEARRRLESVGATVAGYVLNAVPSSETRDYYADYRYDPRARKASGGNKDGQPSPSNVRAGSHLRPAEPTDVDAGAPT
jgi:succinoglycan biosynthesis transport protein ExoP